MPSDELMMWLDLMIEQEPASDAYDYDTLVAVRERLVAAEAENERLHEKVANQKYRLGQLERKYASAKGSYRRPLAVIRNRYRAGNDRMRAALEEVRDLTFYRPLSTKALAEQVVREINDKVRAALPDPT